MSKSKKSAGISLLEIVVSMMILALVLVGLINVFVVSRGYMAHSHSRVSASQLGTVFLDPLQNEVNQSSWDAAGNKLKVGVHTGGTTTLDNVTYASEYNVTNLSDSVPDSNLMLRRVNINITWNETR